MSFRDCHPPMRYPYPAYARRLARNSVALWAPLHLVSRFVADAATPPPIAGLVVVAVTATLIWLDGQRFREHLFHQNLGTSPAWAVGIALGAAGTLEVLARLVLRSLS
jgi:hypothetical protein